MFSKKQYFPFLTPREQSDVTKRLSLIARAHLGEDPEDLVMNWIEEERELVAAGCSFRPWIEPYLDDEAFFKESVRYLSFDLRQKEFQEGQKARQRAYRAAAPATPKQIKYLKNLLRKRGETPSGPLEQLTKGEASEWIEKLTGEPDPDASELE